MRLPKRILAIAGATGLALLTAPVSASAQTSAHQPSSANAVVRAAHFSPDTPGVDVYLTSYSGASSKVWQSDVGYGDVTAYRTLKPGLYLVAMRVHGAPASSPAGLKWTLNARAGRAYTVAAIGTNKNLTGVVLRDTLAAPANGHGLVRVIQAASRAPQARLVAEPNTVLTTAARFATSTGYRSVAAGTWTVQATSVTHPDTATTRQITVRAGTISSVVVLDAKGTGIQLRTYADASGTAIAPQGSIDAGGGGTAAQPVSASTAPAGIAAVLVLGAATMLLRRRQAVRG